MEPVNQISNKFKIIIIILYCNEPSTIVLLNDILLDAPYTKLIALKIASVSLQTLQYLFTNGINYFFLSQYSYILHSSSINTGKIFFWQVL